MDYAEIYAVDFDGTLNLADTYPELGDPNVELIEFLKERREAGDKIILWTCREGELLKAAVKYCNNYGLFFHAVNENLPENIAYFGNNCRKVWAHHYIDDKNMISGLTLEEIKELAERDTAKMPRYEGDGYSEGEIVYDTWFCPNCEEEYEVDYDDYDFCPNCGQRLKWENE